MTIQTTKKLTGQGIGPTVADVRELIEGLNDESVISIYKFAGDLHDPATWTLSVTS